MKVTNPQVATFNSPLEIGVRSLAILVSAMPSSLDLERLTVFDYFVIHSADAGGPSSLHAPVPLRRAGVTLRRGSIESGLMLLMSRDLAEREIDADGLSYRASELGAVFYASMTAKYLEDLKDRAGWVVRTFSGLTRDGLKDRADQILGRWVEEFQAEHDSDRSEL